MDTGANFTLNGLNKLSSDEIFELIKPENLINLYENQNKRKKQN